MIFEEVSEPSAIIKIAALFIPLNSAIYSKHPNLLLIPFSAFLDPC